METKKTTETTETEVAGTIKTTIIETELEKTELEKTDGNGNKTDIIANKDKNKNVLENKKSRKKKDINIISGNSSNNPGDNSSISNIYSSFYSGIPPLPLLLPSFNRVSIADGIDFISYHGRNCKAILMKRDKICNLKNADVNRAREEYGLIDKKQYVYILFGNVVINYINFIQFYPGKTDNSLENRLKSHEKDPGKWWYNKVIAFTNRDNIVMDDEFNTGHLEQAAFDFLNAYNNGWMITETTRPGGDILLTNIKNETNASILPCILSGTKLVCGEDIFNYKETERLFIKGEGDKDKNGLYTLIRGSNDPIMRGRHSALMTPGGLEGSIVFKNSLMWGVGRWAKENHESKTYAKIHKKQMELKKHNTIINVLNDDGKEYRKNGRPLYILKMNYVFDSCSGSSQTSLGRSSNGKKDWRRVDDNSITLQDVLDQKSEKKVRNGKKNGNDCADTGITDTDTDTDIDNNI